MEHEYNAQLKIFLEIVPITDKIKDFISINDNTISINDNTLTLNNTLIISVIVNCNIDNLCEKETEQLDEIEEEYESIYNPTFEEVWKTI